MPTVITSVRLGSCTRSEVWPILVDFVGYPAFMADVLAVRIDSHDADRLVSTWKVLLNGSELTWTETDRLVAEQRIEFQQLDGDLEVWHGTWALVDRDDGLHVDLEVTFDLGIPSLAEVLHPIGERAIRANSKQMLEGIRDRLLLARAV